MISEGKRLFRDIFLSRHGITGLDIITLVTISLSVSSTIVVIIISVWINSKVTTSHHNQSDPIDVAALVSEFSQRLKRLEEGLIDQKVKQEILELRLERSHYGAGGVVGKGSDIQPIVTNPVVTSRSISRKAGISAPKSIQSRLGNTERDVLRIVMGADGPLAAKEIQQRIGKTREHTARMLNSLFMDGFLERNTGVRPYSYAITDHGRSVLES